MYIAMYQYMEFIQVFYEAELREIQKGQYAAKDYHWKEDWVKAFWIVSSTSNFPANDGSSTPNTMDYAAVYLLSTANLGYTYTYIVNQIKDAVIAVRSFP